MNCATIKLQLLAFHFIDAWLYKQWQNSGTPSQSKNQLLEPSATFIAGVFCQARSLYVTTFSDKGVAGSQGLKASSDSRWQAALERFTFLLYIFFYLFLAISCWLGIGPCSDVLVELTDNDIEVWLVQGIALQFKYTRNIKRTCYLTNCDSDTISNASVLSWFLHFSQVRKPNYRAISFLELMLIKLFNHSVVNFQKLKPYHHWQLYWSSRFRSV